MEGTGWAGLRNSKDQHHQNRGMNQAHDRRDRGTGQIMQALEAIVSILFFTLRQIGSHEGFELRETAK